MAQVKTADVVSLLREMEVEINQLRDRNRVLVSAGEYALSILDRDGIAPLRGTAFTDTDLHFIQQAVRASKGESK